MAEKTNLSHLFQTEVQRLAADGAGREKLTALLAAHPGLATVELPGGVHPIDHALHERNDWKARKFAVAAYLETKPDERKIYNENIARDIKAAKAKAAQTKDLFTAADEEKIHERAEKAVLAGQAGKAQHPAVAAYLGAQELSKWKIAHADARQDGDSYLHIAARENNSRVIELLLDEARRFIALAPHPGEASIASYLNAANDKKQTPLMAAVHSGAENAVETLLASGKPHDIQTQAALNIAAAQGRLSILRKLDAVTKNYQEKPFRLAVLGGHKPIVAHYLANLPKDPGEKQEALDDALCCAVTTDMAKMLKDAGANVTMALHKKRIYASDSLTEYGIDSIPVDHKAVFDFLLANGADTNFRHFKKPPVVSAMDRGENKEIVLALLEKTKDLRASLGAPFGDTILHRVITSHDEDRGDFIKAIIKKDPATANVADDKGRYPIEIALTRSDAGAVALLAPHTDLDHRNNAGETLAELAIDNLLRTRSLNLERMNSGLDMLKAVATSENVKITEATDERSPLRLLNKTIKDYETKMQKGPLSEQELIHKDTLIHARAILGSAAPREKTTGQSPLQNPAALQDALAAATTIAQSNQHMTTQTQPKPLAPAKQPTAHR